MSDEMKAQTSEEAATWYARMLRSDAAMHQADFERWLWASDAHRQAYDRLSRQYERSAVLAHSASFGQHRPEARGRRLLPIGFGVGAALTGLATAAAMLLSLSGVFTTLLNPTNPSAVGAVASSGPQDRSEFRLASSTGQIRQVNLPDGSTVTLDTGAVVTVAYGENQRHLNLVAGRARFNVSHEHRPFIVTAGTGDITAHGTVFDVEILGRGGVQVALLRGAIGVRVRDTRTNREIRREMIAHQRADFDATGFVTPVRALPLQATDWPSGVLDVDAMALTDLLAQTNRYTASPIEIADSELASLKVSGRFHVNQPDLVVQNLADLFDLRVDRGEDGRILLKKKISTSQESA